MHAVRMMFLGFIVVLLAGCAGPATIFNTTADGKVDNLMLKGYDPVSYFKGAAPVIGKPELSATHEHGTYYFANAENLTAFKAAPAKFAPQYGGFCANGLVYAIKLGGEPLAYRVVDGKLYIFGEGSSRNFWAMDIPKNVALGDKYWKEEAQHAVARDQNMKRFSTKVPHYKTGKELNEEYQAWLAKGNKPLP